MYESAGKGGLSPYTTSLSEALARNNAHVTLLTSTNFIRNNDHFDIAPCLKPMSQKRWVLRFKPFWAMDRIYKTLFNAYLRNLISFKTKPDIVHLQVASPIVDQFLLPRLSNKIKTILTVHDVVWHDPKNLNNRKKLLRKIYTGVHHIIVHTRKNKEQLIDEFHVSSHRITVIPHGTDRLRTGPVKAVETRKRFGIPSDVPVILFFGNIRNNKGLDLLFHAMHLLKEENVRARLVVAGRMPSGITFERYDKIIDELELRSNLILHVDWISDDEMRAYFEVADIVVLPYTSFASQSGVLLQAYKYNKPVVVTNVGGMGEIVAEDCAGIVVEPSSDDIAGGIKKLINDREYYCNAALNMAQAVNNKYAWEIVAKKTLSTYENVLSGTGKEA
jgi:glycosyltransferase involved in cell wall biosynthesis